MPPEVEIAMLHLDYLSCFLTILATVLVSRKSWTGLLISIVNFFFQAEDGIRDHCVTGVQTCALPICKRDGLGRGARLPRPRHDPRRRRDRPASRPVPAGAV